ncbi:MAG: DUF5719 family protein [Nocardioidaceae bacterium]|nr:DUF5719 family protein [Nocardioidaceae bacterium]MCL2613068.1 DUF5719 family protein [Nocardioidaceae bacterium]
MSEPRSSRRADRNAAAPGRRAGGGGRRRVDVVVALAIALPVVVAIGMGSIGSGPDTAAHGGSPTLTGLTSASLTCPGPAGKQAEPVVVARAPRVAGGPVTVRSSGSGTRLTSSKQVTATPSSPASFAGPGPTVLDAEGASAPGLVAGRREPAAAAACSVPSYDQWYVGLGASAINDSVLVLTNPDPGQAVVDTELFGTNGPISADQLRGIVVPSHGVVTVDLAKKVPTRATFAAHVQVSRGRVGVSVEHRYDRLGGAKVVSDYVPALDGASTDQSLVGAPSQTKSLLLANPGNNEARATVRVLTSSSVFTPTGTQPVVVPPQSVVRVSMGHVVPPSAAKGMLGLVVDSDHPVLATTRGMVGGDMSMVGASPTITGPTGAVVPDGPTKLVMAGAARAGVVDLTATDAKGHTLLSNKSVDVAPGRGVSVQLPKGAAVVTLDPRNTSIQASLVTLAKDASSVVPIRDTVVHAEVPAIRPH